MKLGAQSSIRTRELYLTAAEASETVTVIGFISFSLFGCADVIDQIWIGASSSPSHSLGRLSLFAAQALLLGIFGCFGFPKGLVHFNSPISVKLC